MKLLFALRLLQVLITALTFQAMRVIINDKRYGALKTLGERKEAFNEVKLKF